MSATSLGQLVPGQSARFEFDHRPEGRVSAPPVDFEALAAAEKIRRQEARQRAGAKAPVRQPR